MNLGAVYVVGLLVLLISIIPVFLALRLARDTVTPARMGGGATAGPVGTV